MKFISETDTEVISKLIKYMYTLYPDSSFCELVEKTIMQLEGKGFSPVKYLLQLIEHPILWIPNILFVSFLSIFSR